MAFILLKAPSADCIVSLQEVAVYRTLKAKKKRLSYCQEVYSLNEQGVGKQMSSNALQQHFNWEQQALVEG